MRNGLVVLAGSRWTTALVRSRLDGRGCFGGWQHDVLQYKKNGPVSISPNDGLAWLTLGSDRDWTAVASSVDGPNVGGLPATLTGSTAGPDLDSSRAPFRHWKSVASSADGQKAVCGGAQRLDLHLGHQGKRLDRALDRCSPKLDLSSLIR